MTDRWTDRLSDYVDGQLAAPEREELETHLGTCADCTAVLEGLRVVVERARTLESAPPADDLWPAIEARLASAGARALGDPDTATAPPPSARRSIVPFFRPAFRFSVSLPQAAAAALLLALLSGGGVWMALRHASGVAGNGVAARPGVTGLIAGTGEATTSPRTAPVVAVASPGATQASYAGFDPSHYDAAIADLERTMREHRSELDTSTVRVVEQNLAIIDHAIDQARRALAADPASPYLNGHLAQQLRLKMDLLRRVTDFAGPRG
jgi:anti-sigma factor RsiW